MNKNINLPDPAIQKINMDAGTPYPDSKPGANYVPCLAGTPYPYSKPAASVSLLSYGNIEAIEDSAIRQNYLSRMKNIFIDTSNDKGTSSGGANYVPCLYNIVNTNKQNPYSCGGMKKYKDAYGSQENCFESSYYINKKF